MPTVITATGTPSDSRAFTVVTTIIGVIVLGFVTYVVGNINGKKAVRGEIANYTLIPREVEQQRIEAMEKAAAYIWLVEKAREYKAPLHHVEIIRETLGEFGIQWDTGATRINIPDWLTADLLLRMAKRESAFNERAVGSSGEIGLMQVMPATAEAIEKGSTARLRDPTHNVRIAIKYLLLLHKKYSHIDEVIHHYDLREVILMAYNRGPNAVDAALRDGTMHFDYSNLVLSFSLGYGSPV